MAIFAIVVEGAHDASFLGQLLKARGFKAANKLSFVPVEWRSLFPKNFPMDGENLERVMRFPEVFTKDDVSIGITTAGSDSRLISTLRAVVDAVGSDTVTGIAVFVDIDKHGAANRFASMQEQIVAMNSAASKEGQPGYPIIVPTAPGVMEKGSPALGVYLFPDNTQNGALEDILIECARVNHPEITTEALALIKKIDATCKDDQRDLKNLRSGMGFGKATVGTIANVLKPGSSVASSLSQTSWLTDAAMENAFVGKADSFLGSLLESN